MNTLKHTLLTLTLLITATASYADSLKAEVHGLVCAFCAQGIEKKLKTLPQTQAVHVNLGARLVVMELKPNQNYSPEALATLIKDAGYTVKNVALVPESAAQIKAIVTTK